MTSQFTGSPAPGWAGMMRITSSSQATVHHLSQVITASSQWARQHRCDYRRPIPSQPHLPWGRGGRAVPAVLEVGGPFHLRGGDAVPGPCVAVVPDVLPGQTDAVCLDEPLGPAAQTVESHRSGRYRVASRHCCVPSPKWSTVAAISRTRSGVIPVRCSTARGCSVGSSSTKGRSPTGRVCTRVFRLRVVAG